MEEWKSELVKTLRDEFGIEDISDLEYRLNKTRKLDIAIFVEEEC